MTNIWSGSWESNIQCNSEAATHKECPHHGMPYTGSWPLTLLVTFVVDVHGLHGHRAKNSPSEEPSGARVTPLDVNIMHGEGEILPPGPAPPKVARERWPDHVPFIRIADGSHRFVVQLCYLAVHTVAQTQHETEPLRPGTAHHQDSWAGGSVFITMQVTTTHVKYAMPLLSNNNNYQMALFGEILTLFEIAFLLNPGHLPFKVVQNRRKAGDSTKFMGMLSAAIHLARAARLSLHLALPTV